MTTGLIEAKPRKTHPYEWTNDVPVRRLRRAYLESGMTVQEVSLRLGWTRTNSRRETVPDTTRVLRALGLQQYSQSPRNGKNARPGGKRIRQTIAHKLAKELCDVLGVLPTEVGF